MMSVHRETILPCGPATGRLIVAQQCLMSTSDALMSSKGRTGARHEGLVFWIGRTVGTSTLVLAAAQPKTTSTPGSVQVSEKDVGEIFYRAKQLGLGIVAQVHSHPGDDTRHSDGDDQLVLMPFAGMFSLVVANYGHGSLLPGEGAGLHQYQEDHWTLVTDSSAMTVVSGQIEVRPK